MRSVSRWAALGLVAGSVAGLGVIFPSSARTGDLAEQVAASVPLNEVVQAANQQLEARVVSAHLASGAERYQVRMVEKDGQRWRLEFAAGSGELLEMVRVEEEMVPDEREGAEAPAAFFGRKTPEGYPEW
jgi:RNA-splicing ligase RtcB